MVEEVVDKKKKECDNCGNKFSRSDNLKRHQYSCKVKNNAELELKSDQKQQSDGTSHIDERSETNTVDEDNITLKSSNPQLTTSFINKIINTTPNEHDDSIIEPSIRNGKDDSVRNLDEVFTVHETGKKLNITPAYDSEGESIVGDDYKSEEDDENMELDQDKGNVTVISEDESDSENITKDELKARLYTLSNTMKIFGLKLVADRALSNIELSEYISMLKVPKFRNVFHVDELPRKVNDVECGIINISSHNQMRTHWVCYVKIHKTRMFFDSFGGNTPIQIQKYLKTNKEFKNNTPVIQRNYDIVQRVNTKICGHLCLFVLTSLMRERFFSYHQVMDQLRCAFEEHYY